MSGYLCTIYHTYVEKKYVGSNYASIIWHADIFKSMIL